MKSNKSDLIARLMGTAPAVPVAPPAPVAAPVVPAAPAVPEPKIVPIPYLWAVVGALIAFPSPIKRPDGRVFSHGIVYSIPAGIVRRNERTGKYYTMDSGEFVALFPSAEYAARYVTDPAQDPQGRRFLRTTCNAHSIPLCDALAGSLVINAMK